ncbi:MAG: hypothetical protein IPK58_14235 [Acidobacteria bacterium]|nr:hypothetical protein [Acidobacteriota bacterium]
MSVHGRGAVEAWSFDALGMTTVTYDDGSLALRAGTLTPCAFPHSGPFASNA